MSLNLAKDRMVIVEVGSWIGSSTFIMAKIAAEVGGSVIAIDHWQGSGDLVSLARTYDVMGMFLNLCKAYGYLGQVVVPIIADSLIASRICRENVADLVFIDAGHMYPEVLRDLSAWYPKLKPGGLFCGHDCERAYRDLSQAEQALAEPGEQEFLKDIGHIGVMKATHDFLRGDLRVMDGSTIWYHIKPGAS